MERRAGQPVMHQADEAIGDALTVAQARILRGFTPSEVTDYEERMRQASKGGCGRESIQALYFLASHHSDLFRTMILLGSDARHGEPFNEQWSHHAYFLVEDTDGIWTAGSPANYRAGSENRFTTLIKDDSLLTVLATITKKDGGSWPSDAYIEYTLSRIKHRPWIQPIPRTSLSLFSFTTVMQKNSYTYADVHTAFMEEDGSLREILRL